MPLSPSPTSPHTASAPFQHNVEDDFSGGGNVVVGPMHIGQGRQVWGRAMQSIVVGDDVVVVGGGGRRRPRPAPLNAKVLVVVAVVGSLE